MFKLKNKHSFKFIPDSKDIELTVPVLKPAKHYYPNWLKEFPNTAINESGVKVGTATQCMPFTDSFITGYIQELICDVEILNLGKSKTNEDILSYRWAGSIRPIKSRSEENGSPNLFPKFTGYYRCDLQWLSHWEPHTPKGYSTFYSHPFNRPDLPFYTMNGIIDTDNWPLSGPIPFLVKEGFEGVIPAGTPIYQILFFKREHWLSEKASYDEALDKSLTYKVKRHFSGGYKKEFWKKKFYQ